MHMSYVGRAYDSLGTLLDCTLPQLLRFLFQEKWQNPRSAAFPGPGNLLLRFPGWKSIEDFPRFPCQESQECWQWCITKNTFASLSIIAHG